MLQLARKSLRGLFTFVLFVGAASFLPSAEAQLIFNPGTGGGGGGSGTVTSIGITQTGAALTITNTPITTNGNINLAFSATGIATFLATPSSANLFSTLTTKTGSGGSVVFATGPTVSGLILSDVATGTQCLHANSSGVVSGTGSDCGVGGGDTITTPNSTLVVGGTTTNTTLDVNLTNPNSWTGLQTFGAHASIAATAHGVLVSENTSAAVALTAGATNTVLLGSTGADPAFGAVPLAAMATQGANTILGNYTAGTAVPTAGAAPSGGTSGCSGSTDAVIYTASTGWGCHQISGASTALSSVTAASTTNTIANGDHGSQIWNWAQTTAGQVAFTFGETTAATSTGTPYELRVTTLAGSTATPLKVDNSLTGSQTLPALSILPTWNTSGVVDAALLINVTNTGSGTASLLFDAQVGGTSQFKVDKAGNVTALTSMAVGNPAGGVGSSVFLTQEGTVPASLSAAGQDNCYADSTQHGILCNFNAGTTLPLVQGPASDTSGHVASFTGTNGGALADSGVVASNIVTAAGTLTSTAIMTGAGSKTAQTPSTTSTLDGSGNLAVAAGGSVGSADTGTPKLTFAASKMTANQPLVLGTTSNQLVTGTTTNLTTLTFPASSGAVTLTFPITSELMVGSNSDTTTTHVLHATAVAGVGSFSAIATGDLPAIPLSGLATQANATFVSNVSGGTAVPSANALPTTSNALIKTSNANGALAASTLLDNATTVSTTEPFVSSTHNTCPDTSASGSAQVCNTTPTFTVVAGSCVTYTTTTANTGAGLTLNVNSLGAKSVAKWQGSTTLTANDVLANKEVLACYDGTNWELATIGNAPGGAVSSVNTLTGAVVIEAATSGQMAVSGGSGAALTGAADMTYTTHTFATITTGIFDWSAATGASSFKLPAVVGGTILAGTSTANLSAPIVIQNTNSSNNNTSITMGITSPGTSTGQTTLNVNGATTGGDLADFGTGGTWVSGVLSGQTIVGSILINGAYQAKGTTAGFLALTQGSTSSSVAPCNAANTHCIQAPTAVTASVETDAPAQAQGIPTRTGVAATIQDGYSGDANHAATVTIGSGTSIGSTSLCSTAICLVGTYRVNVYVDITTACGTTGTYVVNLIYTDDQGSKTVPVNLSGTGSVPATGVLTTTSTANFGYDSFILRSTGAASINYSTTAVACGTAGPMVGKMYLSVEPVQ